MHFLWKKDTFCSFFTFFMSKRLFSWEFNVFQGSNMSKNLFVSEQRSLFFLFQTKTMSNDHFLCEKVNFCVELKKNEGKEKNLTWFLCVELEKKSLFVYFRPFFQEHKSDVCSRIYAKCRSRLKRLFFRRFFASKWVNVTF